VIDPIIKKVAVPVVKNTVQIKIPMPSEVKGTILALENKATDYTDNNYTPKK